MPENMVKDFKSILEMGSERVVADLAVKVLEDVTESFKDILDLCFIAGSILMSSILTLMKPSTKPSDRK
jgi:hypothetical protein